MGLMSCNIEYTIKRLRKKRSSLKQEKKSSFVPKKYNSMQIKRKEK